MRYRVDHSKIKFISRRRHVTSSISPILRVSLSLTPGEETKRDRENEVGSFSSSLLETSLNNNFLAIAISMSKPAN